MLFVIFQIVFLITFDLKNYFVLDASVSELNIIRYLRFYFYYFALDQLLPIKYTINHWDHRNAFFGIFIRIYIKVRFKGVKWFSHVALVRIMQAFQRLAFLCTIQIFYWRKRVQVFTMALVFQFSVLSQRIWFF